MKQKNSYINKGIIYNLVTSNMLVSVVFFGILTIFTTTPFYLLLKKEIKDGSHKDQSYIMHELYSKYPMALIAVMVISLVISLIVFKRLFNKESSDVLNSMPVSRGAVYISHLISSVILSIVPILMTGLILIIIAVILAPGNIPFIVFYSLLSMLASGMVCSLVAFISSFCGNIFMATFMCTTISFVPLSIAHLINTLLLLTVNGYIGFVRHDIPLPINYLSPLVGILDYYKIELVYSETTASIYYKTSVDVILVMVFWMLLPALAGYVIYTKRKTESVQWINQSLLKGLIVLIATAYMGLVFGVVDTLLILPDFTPFSLAFNITLGALIGFIFGHYLAYQNLFFYRKLKLLVFTFLGIGISIFGLIVIGNQVKSTVPDTDQLVSIAIYEGASDIYFVEFDTYLADWIEEKNDLFDDRTKTYTEFGWNEFEEKENMEKIKKFIEEAFKQKNFDVSLYNDSIAGQSDKRIMNIEYSYKDGRKECQLLRMERAVFDSLFEKYLKEVILSEEYKYKYLEAFFYDRKYLESVTLSYTQYNEEIEGNETIEKVITDKEGIDYLFNSFEDEAQWVEEYKDTYSFWDYSGDRLDIRLMYKNGDEEAIGSFRLYDNREEHLRRLENE